VSFAQITCHNFISTADTANNESALLKNITHILGIIFLMIACQFSQL